MLTSEDRASIFVTEAVKEALEAAAITGVEFDRLSEIERPPRDDGDDELDA